MLKEKQAFALWRVQLEKIQERECWNCKKFGHLACNCKIKKEGEKEKKEQPQQSKFEVLASKVIRSVSQTWFGPISINFSMISMILTAPKSPQKDLSINT